MNSDLAMHISECLNEFEGVNVKWRVIQKYAADFEHDWLKRLSIHGVTIEESTYDHKLNRYRLVIKYKRKTTSVYVPFHIVFGYGHPQGFKKLLEHGKAKINKKLLLEKLK